MTDTRNPILRKAGPGKFDTILDEQIYQLSLDGVDDECGDSSAGARWYGKLDGVLTVEDPTEPLTEDERAYLAEQGSGGAILSEDAQGFVTIEYFASADELETSWERIADGVREDERKDEDDEDRDWQDEMGGGF